MTPSEANLIRQIRKIGVQRAKDIFSFLFLWEGEKMSDDMAETFAQAEEEEAPPSGVSHKRMTQLTLVGEAVLASFPKRGRKSGQINPDSAQQKCYRAVKEILTERGPMMRSEILPLIAERTGLSGGQVANASSSIPFVQRYNGLWSLKATKKAA